MADTEAWQLQFEALDLYIPEPPIKVETQADGSLTCTKTEKTDPISLQLKANRFRKGYKDWRQHKARGARGDVSDIIREREGENLVQEDHRDRSISASPTSSLIRRFQSLNQLAGAEEPKDAVKNKEEPDLTANGSATQSESWLRFYVNPYANLLDENLKTLPLRQFNLDLLDQNFKVVRGKIPKYHRTAGMQYQRICHVGVGGFHRSHQAVFTDNLLELHKDRQDTRPWGICGIGLMPWDKKMYDTLRQQDFMYTVLFRSQEGNDARVIGSIFDYIFAPNDYKRLLSVLSDLDTKIVSLTITEKGYCQTVDGHLDVNDPNIKHDLQNLLEPRSAIGMIVTALELRRRTGSPPFTVLSCDNMPENGTQLKKLVLEMAELSVGLILRYWITKRVKFPNTMVDRITPATDTEHKDILRQDFGVEDDWPVVAEHFGQWIVEEDFVDGERPPWEDVGVMFVPDVKPYEFMKLRLLNGGHSALSYVSWLNGFVFVDDALNNNLVYSFVSDYMDEMSHSVPSVPGVDLDAYKKQLLHRFSNPYVKDKVERLMLDGSKKLPNTMREGIHYLDKQDLSMKTVALAVAAYIRYVAGVDDEGKDYPNPVLDPMAAVLKAPAMAAIGRGEGGVQVKTHYDPTPVILLVFGRETAETKAFVAQVSVFLKMITEKGMEYTLLNR